MSDKDDGSGKDMDVDDIVNFERRDYCFIKLTNKTQYLGKVNIQKIDGDRFLMIYDPIEVDYEIDPDFEEPMMYFMNPLFATKQEVLPLEMKHIEFFGEMNDDYHELYVTHTGLEMDASDIDLDKKVEEDKPIKKKGNVLYLGRVKKD